jgi:hypothetical protein
MEEFSFWDNKSPEEIQVYLIKELRNYHCHYFIEIGVEPDKDYQCLCWI